MGSRRARRQAVRAQRLTQRRRGRSRRPRAHVIPATGGRRHPGSRRISRRTQMVILRIEHSRGLRRRHRTRHVHRTRPRLRVQPGRRHGPAHRRRRARVTHRPGRRRQHLRRRRDGDPQHRHG